MGYLYTDLIEYKSGNVIKDAAASEPKAGSFCFWSSFITCMVFISHHLFSLNNTNESVNLQLVYTVLKRNFTASLD